MDAVLDDLVAEGVRIMKEDFVAHLLTADKQSAVPLVGVRCNVVIQDMAADVCRYLGVKRLCAGSAWFVFRFSCWCCLPGATGARPWNDHISCLVGGSPSLQILNQPGSHTAHPSRR